MSSTIDLARSSLPCFSSMDAFLNFSNLISLSDEVEAFVPKAHSMKDSGSVITVGETLNFRILEFSIENKRILASHTATFEQGLETERKKSAAATKKIIKKMEDDKQQSTLGDLDSLASLKEDLESDN